jgi:hypothetical protein
MTASLRDAIGQDVFRIDDDLYSDAGFKAMSIDELERVKLRICNRVSWLSFAITNKKIEDHGRDDKSIDWYKSHRAALWINERVLAYVKNIISKRLRMSKTTGDCFMRQAKAVLPREVFERILCDANKNNNLEGVLE